MSAARKRSARRGRTATAVAEPELTDAKKNEASGVLPMPEWHWRTMPVFFAFSLGGFIGLELGIIAGSVDNNGITFAALTVFALMFGLAFSRVMTRFLLSRRWIKPRTRKKR